MPDLTKMSKEKLKEECRMWRELWNWLDPDVKYYLARTGKQVAVTMINYHRYMGMLLQTKWDLKNVEIGVFEKVYDHNTGKYFFERKIVRLEANNIRDFQIIEERQEEEEVYGTPEQIDSDTEIQQEVEE